jgi:hypothetical protein
MIRWEAGVEIPFWLVAGLSAFDLMIVSAAYFLLRTHPPMEGRALFAVGAGMAGFVFQAILCFEGAVLILQLATILGVLGACSLQHLGWWSKREGTMARDTAR